VGSIYFGGGTPSCVAEGVAQTLVRICSLLPVAPDAEITVEANPESASEAVLALLADAGFGRVSLGVQSLDDAVLAWLGRKHDAHEALAAVRAAAQAGMAVSADLICGVPAQSMASWRESVRTIAASGAGHTSVYPLTVEEGTPLEARIRSRAAAEPDPDAAADMMLSADRILSEAGFSRYEVANWARSEAERSRHNTAYWTGASYLGLGPAAHGMLDHATAKAACLAPCSPHTARVRYANPSELDAWRAGEPPVIEELTAAEALREDVMLGLRLIEGVEDALVEAAGVLDALAGLERDGLVQHGAGRWHTTERGWLLGNEVFSRVWCASTDEVPGTPEGS
jgi:oxygen-independent coproporphyrinogen-3 oxidase